MVAAAAAPPWASLGPDNNKVADALSRIGYCMAVTVVSAVQPVWLQEVLNSYVTDPDAQNLLAQLCVHSPDKHGHSLSQGVIRKDNIIWVGNNSALRTKIVAALHDSAVGDHSGMHATYHRLNSEEIVLVERYEGRCGGFCATVRGDNGP
jgi:hypothetical protein